MILFFVQKKQKGFNNDLTELKAAYDRELFKAQLETQEQTFKEMAREIHDNTGQVLSMAKRGLGMLEFDRKKETEDCIDEISDLLETALDDLRHMSRTMNSDIIKNGGLIKSIEMHVGFLQRGGKMNTQFSVNGDEIRLDETKEIFLFRIIQEAINNIIRHSAAEKISIFLNYNKNCLKMKIEDNGKGFDLKEQFANPSQINGIYNMQRRAKLIAADFEIDSEVGRGTQIVVTTAY
jgi:signal transduction histidine kinase